MRYWTADEELVLRTLWTKGCTSGEIAQHLGRGRGAITGKLGRLGTAPLSKAAISERNRIGRLGRVRDETAETYKPPKPPKPARVMPNDPASMVAAALLESAQRAQRRRDQFRSQRNWGAR